MLGFRFQHQLIRLAACYKIPSLHSRFFCESPKSQEGLPKLSSVEKENIRNAVQLLKKDIRHSVWLQRLENCDAYLPHEFTTAFCHTIRSADRGPSGQGVVYNYAGLFVDGINLLQRWLDEPLYEELNLKPHEELALEKLYTCIQSFEELGDKLGTLCNVAKFEAIWRTPVLYHLLSKLSLNPNYMMDGYSKDHPSHCNCCGGDITGKYGDTSMGNMAVWHGSADILLGSNEVPVHFVANETFYVDDDSSSEEIEIFHRPADYRGHLISQSIVFGCLKKQICPNLRHYLIPTIAISRHSVKFFFFDPVQDILIESSPLDLFIHDSIGYSVPYSTILALWLCINYRHFSSGAPETMLANTEFKANFFNLLPENVKEIYTKRLSLGNCRAKVPDLEFRPVPEGNFKLIEHKF